ncbi:MAG: phosphonoacetate hydrolase [Planctomycetes bacterium]|nr:phosphonoacetate hydrolase [Planctomycetota bacterium]
MARSSASSPAPTSPFEVNGRSYCLPDRPVVAICIDGCADEYLSAALASGRCPNLERLIARGHRSLVRGALPSFTNVNNAAIVCGVPPSVTGISGNFFLDPETGEEIMMTSPDHLRAPTILAAVARAGRKVAMVTAKDKLRRLLSKGLEGIAFSSEKAAETTREEHGIERVPELVGRPVPKIYSAEASAFVLWAGVRLLEEGLADFLYLTLTDYVQHKHAPWEAEAIAFYEQLDEPLGRLLDRGVSIGITADHGMNGKMDDAGAPKVLYVESLLRERFGDGVRVICPITDPYVVHHGALGGLVMVHADDPGRCPEMAAFLLGFDGITEVHDRAAASRKLELPVDRIGDLVVLAARDTVLGRTPERHDLSGLGSVLRSHGGRYEEMVPLVLSEVTPAMRLPLSTDPRSFDLFHYLCPVEVMA